MARLALIVIRESGTLAEPPEVLARVADPVLLVGLAARVAITQAFERVLAFAAAGDPLADAVREDAERLVHELRPLLPTPRDGAEPRYSAAQVAEAAASNEAELAALHGYGLQSAGWRERDYDAARVYSAEDAIAAAVARQLIARGIQPRRAVAIAEDNRPHFGDAKYWLAVRPPAEYRGATSPEQLPHGRDVITLRVDAIAAEVRAALQE